MIGEVREQTSLITSKKIKMNLLIKIVEFIANLSLSISNVFSLIQIKLIDKFEINISKPKHEENILKKVIKTDQNIKKFLSNEEEIKRLKERENIVKEIITKNIININNLNKVSQSEYFIVIPKINMKLNKSTRRILFENEGFFKNSIFEYFKEENFINLGKIWSPFYLKNRDELKKAFQDLIIFKKFIDKKVVGLLNKDNQKIKKAVIKHKDNSKIKEYFFDQKNKLKFNSYLHFEFMITSSLNLNEENLMFVEKDSKIEFLSKILSHEIQDIKLREIILNSGLKLFVKEDYPNEVKKKLFENEYFIKKRLEIENFLEPINRKDLENIFKILLKEKYNKIYVSDFMKVYKLVKEF